jgi:hypothetical protein
MYFYIHVPVDAGWRWLMVTIVPSMGMMVIAVIIMCLITARQGESHDEKETCRR